MSRITAYCHLNENSCSVNGTVLTRRDPDSPDHWLKQVYKEQEFVYPKFYKMDTLSQAGFIATELIKRAHSGLVNSYGDDEIALFFANSHSSAETDIRFRTSYAENGAPSPALFVYTLPNIVMGEIAILNKWYGENMFAVLPKFAPDFFVDYTSVLIASGSRAVLSGWLDVRADKLEVFVWLVEGDQFEGPTFNKDNLAGCAGL